MLIFLLFIFLIIYVLIIDYYNYSYNKELFYDGNDKIHFLNNNESLDILKNDHDNYFKSFYKLDYKSRHINDINEYKLLINKSIDQFSDEEKDKITKCAHSADKILEKISLDWFNGVKCSKIDWNIICIKGKLYENGLPHTRGKYIIISKEDVDKYSLDKLTKTLIHEKVHIYQKIYKKDVEKYLKENNFIIYKNREESDNIRANPDTNNFIYKDKNGVIYSAKYINNNPKSIESISYKPYNSQSYEHPFEKMAIYIEYYN